MQGLAPPGPRAAQWAAPLAAGRRLEAAGRGLEALGERIFLYKAQTRC